MPQQAPTAALGRFSVFRAPEALSNWRAVLLIVSAALGFALFAFIGQQLPSALTWIFIIAGFIFYLAGLSGAGTSLLDQARATPLSSVPEYFVRGLTSLPRLLGLSLLLLAAFLTVFLAAALYLVLCKIPLLGPLLLALGIPILVAAMAIALAGIYVLLTLAGPAIWDGLDIATAFKASVEILRTHTWPALSKIVGGISLSILLGGVFMLFVWSAAGLVAGLGIGILGVSGGGLSGLMMPLGAGFSGANQASLIASGLGFGIVFFVAFALISLMPGMVAVLAWLEFSEKIDLENAREHAATTVNALREKFKEAKEKYTSTPAESVAPPHQAADTVQSPEPAPANLCKNCASPLQPDDKFCEHCGTRVGD